MIFAFPNVPQQIWGGFRLGAGKGGTKIRNIPIPPCPIKQHVLNTEAPQYVDSARR